MKAPTPPKDYKTSKVTNIIYKNHDVDPVEIEQQESMHVVLFEYDDNIVSFNIAFEFVYTFTKEADPWSG